MKFSLWMLALAGLCAATAAHDPPPPAETEIHYRSRGKGRLKMSDDGIVQPPHEDNDGLKNADPKSLSGPDPKTAPDPATVDKLTKSRIHAPMTMAGGNIFARKKKEPSAFCVKAGKKCFPISDENDKCCSMVCQACNKNDHFGKCAESADE